MLPAYIAMDQVWFKVDCVLVRLILFQMTYFTVWDIPMCLVFSFLFVFRHLIREPLPVDSSLLFPWC